jgi:CRP/FNR family transcriptional regulator, cyclic AMP receptor protein
LTDHLSRRHSGCGKSEREGVPVRLLRDDLRDLDLFSEARRSELAVIARQLTRLKVKAGRVLVREGAIGNEFMIMVSGMAEVTQGGQSIATLGRGDLVGEMSLLQPHGSGRRNATVTAVTDAEIYAGSPAEFRRIVEASPSVAEKVQRTIAARTLVAA